MIQTFIYIVVLNCHLYGGEFEGHETMD